MLSFEAQLLSYKYDIYPVAGVTLFIWLGYISRIGNFLMLIEAARFYPFWQMMSWYFCIAGWYLDSFIVSLTLCDKTSLSKAWKWCYCLRDLNNQTPRPLLPNIPIFPSPRRISPTRSCKPTFESIVWAEQVPASRCTHSLQTCEWHPSPNMVVRLGKTDEPAIRITIQNSRGRLLF